MFCVSETHSDGTENLEIDGFDLLIKHRHQPYLRKSGGIGVYIRHSLSKHAQIIECDSEYILWIKLNNLLEGSQDPILLGAIYLPPEGRTP